MKSLITFLAFVIIGLLFWTAYFKGILFTVPTFVIGAVLVWFGKVILETIHG